jgi:hypothetical protein
MNLSPVENIGRSQVARYQRAVWKLRCRELGGFPQIPGHSIDFYRGLCDGAFGDFDNVTNAEFFGTGESMRFSGSADDLGASLMAVAPCTWREVVVLARSHVSNSSAQLSAPYADLRQPAKEESEQLAKDRQTSIRAAVDWLIDACSRRCKKDHGDCIGQTCICLSGYSGELCEKVEVTVGKYKWVTSCVTVGPTLVVLLGALVAWNTILRESNDFRPLAVQKS